MRGWDRVGHSSIATSIVASDTITDGIDIQVHKVIDIFDQVGKSVEACGRHSDGKVRESSDQIWPNFKKKDADDVVRRCATTSRNCILRCFFLTKSSPGPPLARRRGCRLVRRFRVSSAPRQTSFLKSYPPTYCEEITSCQFGIVWLSKCLGS